MNIELILILLLGRLENKINKIYENNNYTSYYLCSTYYLQPKQRQMIIGKVITIGIITVSFMSLYLIGDIIEKRKQSK